MKFIENNRYTLQTDYYNAVTLKCTWSAENFAYFIVMLSGSTMANYKIDKKTEKLYKWNDKFSSWDNIDHTLSEETVEDVWSKRMGNGSDYYNGIGQD